MKRKLSQDAEYVLDLLVAAGHISRETAFRARDIAIDLAPGRTQNQIDALAAPLRTAGVMACHCADRLAGRVDGNVHFEGCPHFVPPDDALRRALGDIISQTVVAERMGYTDPQDWQEKFQRVRQIARNALGVPVPAPGSAAAPFGMEPDDHEYDELGLPDPDGVGVPRG